MKPSLKRKLFFHIFVVTLVIILSNRFTTQLMLLGQLEERGWENLGLALTACDASMDRQEEFRHCVLDKHHDQITSLLAHDYVLCSPTALSNDERSPCHDLQGMQPTSLRKSTELQSSVELIKVQTETQKWLGARYADRPQSPQVWLPESSVMMLRQQLWDIRDRNLAYVVPVLLLMIGLLSVWVAHLLMLPIRLLEDKLSTLTSSNLGQSSNLEAPYVEFTRIVQSFEDLRVRLRDSFSKARRFAADASHELRTPLTILRGNVEQLLNALPVGSDLQVRVRMVGDEVERLIDITEKLLLLSRADGNSMVKEESEFHFSEFLEELVADSHVFHPEIEMRAAIDPDQTWLCDQRLIQQLIYNLYSNAVKYNVAQGWIRISLQSLDQSLVLDMENPCDEIPVDLPQFAFDRFYRGNLAHSRKIDGLGLGLSLCQEIARLHDAELTLTTTSQGTVRVRLTVPRPT